MTFPRIGLCEPNLGDDERRWLGECLDSSYVSSVGSFVERFEQSFAAQVGAAHAVACTSGTAAIHLALHALGVGPRDLVLVSDFTFIASANPVRHCGAEAWFIGSEERSWNLDPEALAEAFAVARAVGRRVKAVIAVHVLGQCADLGPILDLCRAEGALLIEDAAESLGASYGDDYGHPACRGRQVGVIGDVGCFSFNGNKLITTGGGGMCVTADAELARLLKHLSTQAKLPHADYLHDRCGFNFRLPNLNAALGLAQLARMPDFLARKAAIAARYAAVATRRGWTSQPTLPGTHASWWLPSLLVGPRRDAAMAWLEMRGIAARRLWHPLSRQPAWAGARPFGGDLAVRLAAEGLSLPCSTHLSDHDLERVCAALEELPCP